MHPAVTCSCWVLAVAGASTDAIAHFLQVQTTVDSDADQAPRAEGAPGLAADELEVTMSLTDSGMALISTVAPDIQWQSGSANVDVRCAPGALDIAACCHRQSTSSPLCLPQVDRRVLSLLLSDAIPGWDSSLQGS